jgi:hypothetical protein
MQNAKFGCQFENASLKVSKSRGLSEEIHERFHVEGEGLNSIVFQMLFLILLFVRYIRSLRRDSIFACLNCVSLVNFGIATKSNVTNNCICGSVPAVL